MLNLSIIFVCAFFCGITGPSSCGSTKSKDRVVRKLEEAKEPQEFREGNPGDKTARKMLDNITAKVWKNLPIVDVPKSWVLPYCLRYTEIYENVEKAIGQCQHDGTDWDCVFIELGGGQDDFSNGRIVSLFNDISNRGLRIKLLRGAETCGRFWQRYKQAQERRLFRIGVKLPRNLESRRKRSLRNKLSSRNRIPKRWSKKRKNNGSKNFKKRKHAWKETKAVRQKLASQVTKHESRQSSSTEEGTEVNRLYLTTGATTIHTSLQEYNLVAERNELIQLRYIGACFCQEAMKACESIVIAEIRKLT